MARRRLLADRADVRPARHRPTGQAVSPGDEDVFAVPFRAALRVREPPGRAITSFEHHPPLQFPVTANFTYRKKPGRREYLRASLVRENGAVVARRYPKDGAGILSSIVQSDGFVVLDEAISQVAPGATIDFLAFSEVIG